METKCHNERRVPYTSGDLYMLLNSTGQQPDPTIGQESLQYMHVLLGEPPPIHVVDACVFFGFPQLILDQACLGIFAILRSVKHFWVSLLRDDYVDLNRAVQLVLCGYLRFIVQLASVTQKAGLTYFSCWTVNHTCAMLRHFTCLIFISSQVMKSFSTHHIIVALLVMNWGFIVLPCFGHG